jgi:hypothetical protein
MSKRNGLAAGPEATRLRRRFHDDFGFTGNVNRHMSLDAGAELGRSSVGIAS